ncbi:MAG: glutamine ABC transporter substrate-binding protein, partial [Aeromonas veronii]
MRVIPLFWLLFPLGLPAKELVICGTMEPPLKFLDADQKPR